MHICKIYRESVYQTNPLPELYIIDGIKTAFRHMPGIGGLS